MGLGTGNAAARVFDWDVVIIGGKFVILWILFIVLMFMLLFI